MLLPKCFPLQAAVRFARPQKVTSDETSVSCNLFVTFRSYGNATYPVRSYSSPFCHVGLWTNVLESPVTCKKERVNFYRRWRNDSWLFAGKIWCRSQQNSRCSLADQAHCPACVARRVSGLLRAFNADQFCRNFFYFSVRPDRGVGVEDGSNDRLIRIHNL